MAPSRRFFAARSLITVGLQLVFVAYIVHVLWQKRAELRGALELDAFTVASLFVFMALSHAQRALEFTYTLRRLAVKEPFGEGFLLTGAGFLLNQLPLNAGMIMRAAVLKRTYSLPYASYLALVLVNGVVSVAVASAIGLAALFSLEFPRATEVLLALGLGGVLAACSLLLAFPPAWAPRGSGFIVSRLQTLASGVGLIRGDGRSLVVLFAIALSKIVIAGGRVWLCFDALGTAISPFSAALLATVAVLSSLINLTPGNLGLREIALAAISTQLAISYSVGIAAASIDRVVLLIYTFVAGVPGLFVLRKRGYLQGEG